MGTTDEALQALQIVDNAASLAPINRQSHVAVQQATEIVRMALTKDAEVPSHDGAKEPVPAE